MKLLKFTGELSDQLSNDIQKPTAFIYQQLAMRYLIKNSIKYMEKIQFFGLCLLTYIRHMEKVIEPSFNSIKKTNLNGKINFSISWSETLTTIQMSISLKLIY